jgi:hypothetical protein
MEATIIKLNNSASATNSAMVVRTASFEEAFGEYSEARGRGRARRKKRKLERIANRREVKTERRKVKGDRQQERIARRSARKGARQEMRGDQQEARMGRRQRRLDMRQERTEARGTRKDTREIGDQERENYALEQELYRESLRPQDEQDGGYSDEQGGGYSDEQGGGYSDEQDGGYSDGQQNEGDYYEEVDSENWASEPQYYDDEEYGNEGAYGDDNYYESPYDQEETEFYDDSYFNVEGMDGKGAVPTVITETITKIKNNERAFQDLNVKRNDLSERGANTDGIDMQIKKCYGRINELKSSLDDYANADGNPQEKTRRRKVLKRAFGNKKRRRRPAQSGGSEVPVNQELNPEFSKNRIEIPASSNFDAYSDLGRPVIIDGATQSNYSDYTPDLLNDGDETTKIDLFSSFDGGSGKNGKVVLSIAIGVGVGVLALYLAKKKGWI